MTGAAGAAPGVAPAGDPGAGAGPAAGGGTWLVVIDMQRVFADPASDWRAPRFAQTIEPIRRLVPALRPRVVFTRFVAPQRPSGAWRQYYQRWPFALRPPDDPIYQLVPEFAGEPALDVETFGKWGPELAARTGGASRLLLAGVSTDCCVISTALAAADAGVAVQVVADACAGASDETHQQALAVMALYAPLIEVITVAGALAQHRA